MYTTEIFFDSKQFVTFMDKMGDDEAIVEAMLASTDKMEAAADLKAQPGRINWLMRDKHGSPFEHTALKVHVKTPLKVRSEWFRHRIGWSYNELSGRYSVLPARFYLPPPERPLVQVGKPGSYTYVPGTPEQHERTVRTLRLAHTSAYRDYERMLSDGVAKEAARDVLGSGLYTEFVATANVRSALAFLALRTDHPEATFPSTPMWEIARCADQLEIIMEGIWPLTMEAFNRRGRVAP